MTEPDLAEVAAGFGRLLPTTKLEAMFTYEVEVTSRPGSTSMRMPVEFPVARLPSTVTLELFSTSKPMAQFLLTFKRTRMPVDWPT